MRGNGHDHNHGHISPKLESKCPLMAPSVNSVDVLLNHLKATCQSKDKSLIRKLCASMVIAKGWAEDATFKAFCNLNSSCDNNLHHTHSYTLTHSLSISNTDPLSSRVWCCMVFVLLLLKAWFSASSTLRPESLRSFLRNDLRNDLSPEIIPDLRNDLSPEGHVSFWSQRPCFIHNFTLNTRLRTGGV